MAQIVISFDPERKQQAIVLAQELNIPLIETHPHNLDYILYVGSDAISLAKANDNLRPLIVDFLSGSNYHRYRHAGGKNQLIAKACGIKANLKPSVLDLTGGLARDAFVLACLGCNVTLIESNAVIVTLVKDGINRAKQADWFNKLQLTLHHCEATKYLSSIEKEKPDTIYIDPMFPQRTKSALVKKEMRILHDIVGPDQDSHTLLTLAKQYANKRVVVKRPSYADPVNKEAPDLSYKGKSTRFDVYLTYHLPSEK